MKDILEEIIAYKRHEIDERKSFIPLRQLYQLVEPILDIPQPSMREALLSSDTGIIAEFKRKSPTLGWIHRGAKAGDVTLQYQKSGATALSVLTDMEYFGGYDEFVQEARAVGVTLPILYKNFIIDEYQLFQARLSGASAVLLIAANLSKEEVKHLIKLSHELGIEVLLEIHDERELDYAALTPDMCGVNNRHLGTFITDVDISFRLFESLPKDVCKISESGLSDVGTVRELRKVGFRGFLMGEHFMKADRPGQALADFVTELRLSASL